MVCDGMYDKRNLVGTNRNHPLKLNIIDLPPPKNSLKKSLKNILLT